MPLKLTIVWIPLLLARPCVSLAQGLPPETIRGDAVANQREDAPNWEAAAKGYLRELEVATAITQTDQRAVVYRIQLRLATMYETHFRYGEAERYYERASNVARGLFGERSGELVATLNHVGEMQVKQGRLQDGDKSFRQAQKIMESNPGADKFDAATILNNLAAVQHMTGNLSRAAGLMRKVVHTFETDPAADNDEHFGIALSNLATILGDTGALPEALAAAQRAVTILERCGTPENFAMGLVTLGRLRLENGDSTGAEATLQRALRRVASTNEQDGPVAALIFGHLGALYGRSGRHREAESYFQRAIEMNRRLLGPEHPNLLDSMGAYADFLRLAKRKGEAKKLEQYIREHQEKQRQQNPSAASIVDVRTLMRERAH
jgi:tetratricopeptide (TPR) repeat protein